MYVLLIMYCEFCHDLLWHDPVFNEVDLTQSKDLIKNSRWHDYFLTFPSVVASELDVNKSHLWQYLIVGLGQDFYLTDSERETLYNNLLEVHKGIYKHNESYTLLGLLSQVSFTLNESMFINSSVDECSWDFGARRIPCQADWFRPTLTLYGNCYAFNYDGRFNQFGRGPGAGLRLIMNVHTNLNSGKPYSSSITQPNCKIHTEVLTRSTIRYRPLEYLDY